MARLAIVGMLVLVGCQTYPFEPIEPVTVVVAETEPQELRPVLKPNVMLVVDRSQSMLQFTTSGATRLDDLKGAVRTFTTLAGDRLRLGLTLFPRPSMGTGSAATCIAASSVDVALPPASLVDDANASRQNEAVARQVDAVVQGLTASGGTPTGGTLRYLGTVEALKARDFRNDFVVLLTDGLPNCNPDNAADFEVDTVSCRCQTVNGTCFADARRLGCLDADGTTREVEALARAGIRTIVVGFGAATAVPEASAVLERLALAGGVTRRCQADGDCAAGDRCTISPNADMGQCGKSAWQASNRMELERVLTAVLEGLTPLSCAFLLPEPPLSAEKLGISVLVNGQVVSQDKWTRAVDAVVLEKGFCEANTGATVQIKMVSLP